MAKIIINKHVYIFKKKEEIRKSESNLMHNPNGPIINDNSATNELALTPREREK